MAIITANRIKAQLVHCSCYHHHMQADFSLICRKSEEDDKFTANLTLQEQGTCSIFCHGR